MGKECCVGTKIENPAVTLAEEARSGVQEEARSGSGLTCYAIRQWRAYPSILPRELYIDEARTGERFDTL